jgi:hypothetical protein
MESIGQTSALDPQTLRPRPAQETTRTAAITCKKNHRQSNGTAKTTAFHPHITPNQLSVHTANNYPPSIHLQSNCPLLIRQTTLLSSHFQPLLACSQSINPPHNHRHGYIRRLYNKIAQKASYLSRHVTKTVHTIGNCIKSTSLRLIHFPFVKALLQPFIQLTAPLNSLLHSNTNPNLEAKTGPAIPTPINASPTRNTCNTGANSSQEKKDPPSLFTSLFQPKRWVQQYNTPLRCLIQHTPMANSVASEESPGGSGTVVTTPWQ